MGKPTICLGENKGADQLRGYSAFVFATRIVHFLFFLNPKFQASSLLLCLCQTCSETTLLVFPRGGSNFMEKDIGKSTAFEWPVIENRNSY